MKVKEELIKTNNRILKLNLVKATLNISKQYNIRRIEIK